MKLVIDLKKAGSAHLPKGAERFTYKVDSDYGIIYIPTNRLEQVYQTDMALDNKKVNDIKRRMKEGKKLYPIIIGYNYDVQDGHHRWEAAKQLGYTHVPCVVRGTDAKKLSEAKVAYRKLWKSGTKGIHSMLEHIETSVNALFKSTTANTDAVFDQLYSFLTNPLVQEDIVLELKESGIKYMNTMQFLKSMERIKEQEDSTDLIKAELDKTGLVQRRIAVQRDGGTYYRMQWVDPNKDMPKGAQPAQGAEKDNKTWKHSDEGRKEIERAQSNRFPIIHVPIKELKTAGFGGLYDKAAYNRALETYKNGGELPYMKVNGMGEVIDNFHLVQLAKDLKITHIPTIVIGNSELKKEFEQKHTPQSMVRYDNGKAYALGLKKNKSETRKKLSPEIQDRLQYYDYVTKKAYSKTFLEDTATSLGIKWNEEHRAEGERPLDSNIRWMRIDMAIQKYIESGHKFLDKYDRKQAIADMEYKKDLDRINPYFLEAVAEFAGDRDAIVEQARKSGIEWTESKDPSKNYMVCVMAIKSHMRLGGMFNGVRTRQKDLIEEERVHNPSPETKKYVKDLKEVYGRANMMFKARSLGIEWTTTGRTGKQDEYEMTMDNSAYWMRASEQMSIYVERYGEFPISDADRKYNVDEVHFDDEEARAIYEASLNKEGNGGRTTQSTVGPTPAEPVTRVYTTKEVAATPKTKPKKEPETKVEPPAQKKTTIAKENTMSINLGKTNSLGLVKDAKNYIMQSLATEFDSTESESQGLYETIKERLDSAELQIRFNPFEELPNGSTMIEQLLADGVYKNNIELDRTSNYQDFYDAEDYIFGDSYSTIEDTNRPIMAVLDMYGQKSDNGKALGSVSFVMKDKVKDRTTALSNAIEDSPVYDNGQIVRSARSPEVLLYERLFNSAPDTNKSNLNRSNALFSLADSEQVYKDDRKVFESHIHGGVDLSKDVEAVSVPKSWEGSKDYKPQMEQLKTLSELYNVPIRFD